LTINNSRKEDKLPNSNNISKNKDSSKSQQSSWAGIPVQQPKNHTPHVNGRQKTKNSDKHKQSNISEQDSQLVVWPEE